MFNQELAVDLLRRAGVAVSVVGDGQQALDVLGRERFDAVLMDCQMPVMDGYAATRALRLQPALRTLPVIAMTANAMVGDREAVLAAGMNDHIAKPIVINEMFATLAKWVKPTSSAAAGDERPALNTEHALNGVDARRGLDNVGGNGASVLGGSARRRHRRHVAQRDQPPERGRRRTSGKRECACRVIRTPDRGALLAISHVGFAASASTPGGHQYRKFGP